MGIGGLRPSKGGNMHLIHGSGRIMDMLDDVRERILAGEVDGLTVCFTSPSGHTVYGHAWREDAPHVYHRMLTTVTQAQNDLVTNGLPD